MEENLLSSHDLQNGAHGDAIAGARQDRTYALGHSKRELDRLSVQAVMFEPFTRQLFREAGLAPGMRVLDVGSGSGDVAFLAAEEVGPHGEVIGVDVAQPAVAAATARAAARGHANVRFLQGDPAEMTFDRPFDAIVGRLVLLYYPYPVEALRKLAGHLRPGGVIAFQDFDFTGARSLPTAPTVERCLRWMIEAFQAAGTETQMGLKLYPAFVAAGLPAPTMRLDAAVGGGPVQTMYVVIAEVIRSLLPLIEKLGLATAAEVDVDTLADRIRDEVVAGGGVIVSPTLVGAWARRA
jgi:ubiquinone/menaquinone biosynthesis C-methylase UbiE